MLSKVQECPGSGSCLPPPGSALAVFPGTGEGKGFSCMPFNHPCEQSCLTAGHVVSVLGQDGGLSKLPVPQGNLSTSQCQDGAAWVEGSTSQGVKPTWAGSFFLWLKRHR